ncbi:uncharacterized protein LOC18423032 isoform X2 [Amborella trichopoda]|uniref:uncharacterized protein LOC18423032 isoform X2 n=1 Tax=Amborella trichopoda TaxID=13333 RepID=UPI0009BDE832|nr:uncharacterized protein LOC18423032 isoform X2 [Amborella trichopoda]|eukprot:XP_020526203.1 uncharacterized protein LOC18423032 isoform X2 [Amborella trichopoda]
MFFQKTFGLLNVGVLSLLTNHLVFLEVISILGQGSWDLCVESSKNSQLGLSMGLSVAVEECDVHHNINLRSPINKSQRDHYPFIDSFEHQEKHKKGKLSSQKYSNNPHDDRFTEFTFNRSRSPSVKDVPESRRSSIYRSSKLLRNMRNSEIVRGKYNQSPVPFMAIKSPLPSCKVEGDPLSQKKRPPLNSLSSYLNAPPINTMDASLKFLKEFHELTIQSRHQDDTLVSLPNGDDGFLEIFLPSKDIEGQSQHIILEPARRRSPEDEPNIKLFACNEEETLAARTNKECPLENEESFISPKSSSAESSISGLPLKTDAMFMSSKCSSAKSSMSDLPLKFDGLFSSPMSSSANSDMFGLPSKIEGVCSSPRSSAKSNRSDMPDGIFSSPLYSSAKSNMPYLPSKTEQVSLLMSSSRKSDVSDFPMKTEGLFSSPKSPSSKSSSSPLSYGAVFSSPTPFSKPSTMELPHGPENKVSSSSPKHRMSSFRRIFDPIMKSKSLSKLPVSIVAPNDLSLLSSAHIKRSRSLRKSLLQEFSKASFKVHGVLKLVHKHGVPSFEFSVKDPEDFLAARTWKVGNAFNWLYTFHSNSSGKGRSSGGWGRKERSKHSTIVGQMKVSCYLCSKRGIRDSLDYSMVTEFVLSDATHMRRDSEKEEIPNTCPSLKCSDQSVKAPESLVIGFPFEQGCGFETKWERPSRHGFGLGDSDGLGKSFVPLGFQPHLEVAAMVIESPLEKRESLKGKLGDEREDAEECISMSGSCTSDEIASVIQNSNHGASMKVVIPSGVHGIPTDDASWPSPLLDRWRSGGACDCGGWDMACPIRVYENSSVNNGARTSFEGNQSPLELFIEGGREKIPALSMKPLEEGVYAIDFHARFSALQAFSVCVAVLHANETSTISSNAGNQHKLQGSNSLKLLLKDESGSPIETLANFEREKMVGIEAVANNEREKGVRKMEENPSSFILDPPVSPIGRV